MKKEKSISISKALLKNYFGDTGIANFEKRERRLPEPRPDDQKLANENRQPCALEALCA